MRERKYIREGKKKYRERKKDEEEWGRENTLERERKNIEKERRMRERKYIREGKKKYRERKKDEGEKIH